MIENYFENGITFFIISSVVTIILACIADKVIKTLNDRFNKKYEDRITANQYLYLTVRLIVWVVAFTIILKQVKPLSSLGNTILGATSIIAIAVGIAAQTTFGNYIAGFFLAIHQPFKVGDIIFIKERGLSGIVKEINFRHTILLTQEQTEIIIPNTIMNTAVVEDMSSGKYSEIIELNLKGNTDLFKVQEIISSIAQSEPMIDNTRETKLVIKAITKEGYKACFPIYTRSLWDYGDARNSILPKLYKALEDNGIEMF